MNTYKMTIHYYSHFYILTFFEVIFYKYYIFPYENQLILNLIGDKVDEIVAKEGGYDNIKNQYPEVHDFIVKLMFNCGEGANNADNAALFQICDVYLFVSSFLFFALFVVDGSITYYQYAHTTNPLLPLGCNPDTQNDHPNHNLSNMEMNMIVYNTTTIEQDMNIVPFEIISRNDSIEKEKHTTLVQHYIAILRYYGKNSVFLAELVKTLNFIVLIGIFEYAFFAFIVCKLKPVDLNYILCTIMQKLV